MHTLRLFFLALSALNIFSVQAQPVKENIFIVKDSSIVSKEFIFSSTGKIIVCGNASLTIVNCYLRSKEKMWKGIEVEPGGKRFDAAVNRAYYAMFTAVQDYFSLRMFL
jgi:hypothetical protein